MFYYLFNFDKKCERKKEKKALPKKAIEFLF